MVYFWLHITENPMQTHLYNKEYLSETIKSRGRVSFLVWCLNSVIKHPGSCSLPAAMVSSLNAYFLQGCRMALEQYPCSVEERERERYGFL